MSNRKIVVSLLFSFLSIAFLFASVDVSGMTQTQQQQYYRQMLSISEKVITTSDAYGGAWKTSSSTAIGYASAVTSSSLTWDAFQGPNQISKADFFRITGEMSLYNQCKLIEEKIAKKHKDGVLWTIVGGLGCGVGTIIMLSDVSNKNALIGGSIVFGLSCLPLYFGIRDIMYTEEPDVSASFAIGIADVYNQKLAATITAKY